jgi:hypothetical protein
MKYNVIDEEYISYEDFMLNQYFIYKLSNDKYKREILKHLTEEIRINL